MLRNQLAAVRDSSSIVQYKVMFFEGLLGALFTSKNTSKNLLFRYSNERINMDGWNR